MTDELFYGIITIVGKECRWPCSIGSMEATICEPTTILAAASLTAGALGTVATVQAQEQAGKAAQAQANYQAAVARNNSILAGRAASDARAQGETQAAQAAQQGKQLLGRQRATLAANGVDVNSGSALDLQSNTAGENTLDELTIRNNAERQALGFEAQGSNFDAQAGLDTLAGQNEADAANSRAFGSALSGIGTVASRWYDLSRTTKSPGSVIASYPFGHSSIPPT